MKIKMLKDTLLSKYKELLLTKKEVAMELRCSVSSVDRLRKSGALNSTMIGGKVFFTLDEIASFIVFNSRGN